MGVPRQRDALPLWLGGSDGGAGSGGMACLEAVSAEGMYTSARIFSMTSAEKFLLFVFSAFHFIHMLFARSQLAHVLNQEGVKDSKKMHDTAKHFFVCRNKEMLGDRSTIPGKSMIICKKQFTYKIQRICIFVDF